MRGDEFLDKMALMDPAYVEAADMHPAHEEAKTIKRSRKASRILLIAAAVVMVLSVGVLATRHFGLKDMQGIDDNKLTKNGIAGMPEYEAAIEWESRLGYLNRYGTNVITVDMIGDYDIYWDYNAFTQEAKDELDALLEKYGLRMHESRTEAKSVDALYDAAGSRDFMPAVGDSAEMPVGGRYYKDGSFTFNCAAVLPDGTNIRYSLYSLKKGTFIRIGYLGTNMKEFEEWGYRTEDGTDVLLAIRANQSILAADLDNCYVFIHILSGRENTGGHAVGAQTVDKSTLEAFAECFDFVTINSLAE